MKSSKTKTTENAASKKSVSKATHTRARATENRETPKDEGKLMEFFVHELKDLYWAEKHLVEELETMAEEATSEELRDAFTSHRTETEEHVQRL